MAKCFMGYLHSPVSSSLEFASPTLARNMILPEYTKGIIVGDIKIVSRCCIPEYQMPILQAIETMSIKPNQALFPSV
jgi:hypothetical protein